MARFETPQFIEREPKVIGPLTFKNAAYLGAPLAIIFILWFVLAEQSLILFIAISGILEGIGITLAFVKIEGRSVPELLVNAFFFLFRPKTYIWKRDDVNIQFKKEEYVNPLVGKEGVPKDQLVQKSRVSDLAVRVQTKK